MLQQYREHYAALKAAQEEEERLAAEQNAIDAEAERIRLEEEEQREIDAGQDPTLALLEGLVGSGEEDDGLQDVDPKYRKKKDKKTSDELMKPLSRQQQMHLATIQMFLFENERYLRAVEGYVEKFAKVFTPSVAFEEDAAVDPAEDVSVTSSQGRGKNKGSNTCHEHGQHSKEQASQEGRDPSDLAFDDEEGTEGSGPTRYYRDGRKKKHPEIDDESSEEEQGEKGEDAFD